MNYKKLLCTNIKRVRKMRNVTQAGLAELMDVSIESIRNIEQCKSTPTANTIDKICNALKITPYDLLIPPTDSSKAKTIEVINKKLKLCTNEQLQFLDGVINLLRK